MTSTPPIHQAVATSATRLTHAVALVGGVRGALRSGLLETLWRWQPCTTAELSARSHLPQRAVDLTLAALAVGGVATGADADRWVLTAPPEAWALLVGFDENICRFVETGVATRADCDDRYTGVLSVIGRFHDHVIGQVAPSLAEPNARVLELGAGTAPWSRALLAMDPTITAVAVDLPPVIAQLESSLDRSDDADANPDTASLAARIDLRAQDVRSLTLSERFDVIVISGLSRLLSETDNAQLFARCIDLLAPRGRLVICDSLVGGADPDGSQALYALGLAARSRAETLWSGVDFDRWLHAAGFTAAQVLLTEAAGVTVLVAARAPHPGAPANSRTDTEHQNHKDH